MLTLDRAVMPRDQRPGLMLASWRGMTYEQAIEVLTAAFGAEETARLRAEPVKPLSQRQIEILLPLMADIPQPADDPA